jgi:hypothetical protein
MKRLLIVVVAVLLGGLVGLYAEESTLIDFTKLAADTKMGNDKTPSENAATLVDYSGVAGASFTADEISSMKSSLALGNWEVVLASSARTISNTSMSFTKEAQAAPGARPVNGEDMAGKKFLGIRVHFPTEAFNSYALIRPPFDIPAYADKDTLQGNELKVADADVGLGQKFEGYGVVKNVGALKSLSMTVYGSNFPNGIGVTIADQDGKEQTIFLDYLQFDGWRTLTWNNPDYIADVRSRELRKFPLYPMGEPFVKILSINIYRDSTEIGGDMVTYIKDIKITYDKAIIDTQRQINDESVWHILQSRNEARRLAELKRLGNVQVLRFLEKEKMDTTSAGQ